ncbi:MAG: helix-turn-helix domain-containing protein [Thermoleophilia bacterium]
MMRSGGAVVYLIQPEGDGAREALESEFVHLHRYCHEEGLSVVRVVPEKADHCWQAWDDLGASGEDEGGDGSSEAWRMTDFEVRPGGQSAIEALERGAGHLVLSHIFALGFDPRETCRLIYRLEASGAVVHLVQAMTPDDAAIFFGISPNRVRLWLRERKILGYKNSGRWRVNQRSLVDYMMREFDRDDEEACRERSERWRGRAKMALDVIATGITWWGDRKGRS